MGGRSVKAGQSRWFIGYKKHTLRLWLSGYNSHVLLVPLVSWLTPANLNEERLLAPSLRYCWKRWSWRPDLVAADMGYIGAATKKTCRQNWGVAVVTRLRSDMKLVPPFESVRQTICPQGEPLQWLGYEPQDNLHWFGVNSSPRLCGSCWQASTCPRQFAFAPDAHETLLGLLPLSTPVARRLLRQVRPWIEPAQSYEKNQLGLSQIFLNSLRLTWQMSLLADAVVLLRAHAFLHAPPQTPPLEKLLPRQLLIPF